MIPLTRSVFWGPMAIAIMGGLSLATFLTLINLPALYVIFFRVRPPKEVASHTSHELELSRNAEDNAVDNAGEEVAAAEVALT